MNVLKKSVGQWLGEALLVFISILGAFWVENYRERKQEEESYLMTLLAFRSEVYANEGNMRVTFDGPFSYAINKHENTIILQCDSIFGLMNKLLNDADRQNDTDALRIFISSGASNLNDFRNERGLATQLLRFPNLLLADSLSYPVALYSSLMQNEFSQYNLLYNRVGLEFNSFIFKTLEKKKMDNSSLDQSELLTTKSYLNELKASLLFLREQDKLMATLFSKIVLRLDKVLNRRGVDASELDTKNLL